MEVNLNNKRTFAELCFAWLVHAVFLISDHNIVATSFISIRCHTRDVARIFQRGGGGGGGGGVGGHTQGPA